MRQKSSYIKFLLLFLAAFAWSTTTTTTSTCTAVTSPQTIGQVLCNIKVNTFSGIFKLIFVVGYVSGTGLLVAAIFKLKQVKDNPTQIPVSTPMVLFLCAALSIYMPSLIAPAGETIFSSTSIERQPTVSQSADGTRIGTPSIANLMRDGS